MHRLSFTIALLGLATMLSSQSGPHLFSGTGYLSAGQIGLLTDNAETAIVLPAMLASRDGGAWTAGASVRTGIEDLTELSAAVHFMLPWKDQFAAGIQHTGIEGFSEQRITISYSRKLLQKLNAAVQFDLNRNSAEEYGDVYAPSVSVSLHAPLLKEFSMSAWLYNPLGADSRLELPTVARIGFLYQPSEKIGAAIEFEKDWRHELQIKAGIHYMIHQRLGIMIGATTEPAFIHAGLSWNLLKQMSISGGWKYHTRLGSSLSASVSQQFYK